MTNEEYEKLYETVRSLAKIPNIKDKEVNSAIRKIIEYKERRLKEEWDGIVKVFFENRKKNEFKKEIESSYTVVQGDYVVLDKDTNFNYDWRLDNSSNYTTMLIGIDPKTDVVIEHYEAERVGFRTELERHATFTIKEVNEDTIMVYIDSKYKEYHKNGEIIVERGYKIDENTITITNNGREFSIPLKSEAGRELYRIIARIPKPQYDLPEYKDIIGIKKYYTLRLSNFKKYIEIDNVPEIEFNAKETGKTIKINIKKNNSNNISRDR